MYLQVRGIYVLPRTDPELQSNFQITRSTDLQFHKISTPFDEHFTIFVRTNTIK